MSKHIAKGCVVEENIGLCLNPEHWSEEDPAREGLLPIIEEKVYVKVSDIEQMQEKYKASLRLVAELSHENTDLKDRLDRAERIAYWGGKP